MMPPPAARFARAGAGCLVGAALALGTTGCATAWHGKASVEEALATRPERVRVTTSNGDKYVLEAVRLSADGEILGFQWRERFGGQRVVLAADSITKVEIKEIDAGLTALHWLIRAAPLGILFIE